MSNRFTESQIAQAKMILEDQDWLIIDKDDSGEVSDGYHTFNELYEHRHALFALLADNCRPNAWKSLKHEDGSQWDGWFVAGINLDSGPITYHLPMRWFDSFPAPTLDRAPKWDGHTSDQVVERLKAAL